MKWRILNIDKKKSTIDLISENPTSVNVKFRGRLGYYNGPDVMNAICVAQYSNSNLGVNARSVNLLDMEKHLTSKGINARNSFANVVKYGKTYTYKDSYSYYPALYANQKGAGIDTATVNQPDITEGNDPYEESKSITSGGLTTENSSKQASTNGLTVTQTLYSITINEENYGAAANVLANDTLYWMASRFVATGDNAAIFGLRCAYVGVAGYLTYESNNVLHTEEYPLRPVVSLSVNLLTGTKDSTGAWNLK